MKKILLLAAAGLLAFGTKAQNEKSLVFVNGGRQVDAPVEKYGLDDSHVRKLHSESSGKGTGTSGSRWFSHYEAVNQLTSQNIENNRFVFPIWFDSTVRQRFNTGLGTINFSSLNQYIDPFRFQAFNNPVIGGGMYAGLVQIEATTPYKVDSIDVVGAYVRIKNKPNVVDTLIFSVAASNGRYRLPKSQYTWLGNYLTTGQDTMFAYSPVNVDSINRALLSDVTGSNPITWKKILNASNGDTMQSNGNVMLQSITELVPNGGLNVPAGYGFNVTVTFKSGDTWVKNVDSVNGLCRFMPLTSEASDGQRMPYYYYDFGDRNMSGLMFSTDTAGYLPSVIIEALNYQDPGPSAAFFQEFHWISGHVFCQNCELVSVKDRNGLISEVGDAYPNPAANQVTIPFVLKEAADVTVNVSNAVGQVLKTQVLGRIGSGKAVFNTSDLASGLYFITVEANGQRVSNRFVVSH